jgi:hypothetical protein
MLKAAPALVFRPIKRKIKDVEQGIKSAPAGNYLIFIGNSDRLGDSNAVSHFAYAIVC